MPFRRPARPPRRRSLAAIKRAIQICGGQTALAEACKVTQPAVWQWMKRGVTPEMCRRIEKATGGKVKCADLRPDLADMFNGSAGTGVAGR